MSVDLYVCPACEQQATREARVGRLGPTKGVRVVVLKRMPGPSDPSAATCEFCSTPLVLPDFERQLADANRRLDEALGPSPRRTPSSPPRSRATTWRRARTRARTPTSGDLDGWLRS